MYRIKDTNTFVSLNMKDQYDTTPLHVDVNIVSGDVLDIEAFRNWRPEYHDAEFILEDGKYICGWAIEKMSKSMFNVVNPDMIVEKFGADTLRLYENVPRSGGTKQTLGHQRHRRLSSFSEEVLGLVLRPHR